MYKNFSKVRIVNCIEREKEGIVQQRLLQRQSKNVDVSIAFDPEMWGAWKTYKTALDVSDESDWLIMMEDDVSFPVDILARMDFILDSAPKNAFVFFYVPTNNKMKDAYDSNHKIVKTKYNWWMQCTAIPKKHREGLLKTIDEIWPLESDSGDGRVKKYIHVNNVEAYNIMPSLYQHLGTFRSSLGHSGIINGTARQSFCYEPNSKTFEIDWEKEFANPFFDKSAKGLIGFEGLEKGIPLEKFNMKNGKKI